MSISILGSTGSIGRQTLEVMQLLSLKAAALTADKNAALLEKQARLFKPRLVVLRDEKAAKDLAISLNDTNITVASGTAGLEEAAALPETVTVVSAISGVTGLFPALAAIAAKKRLALANKETLVAAGSFVMDAAQRAGAEIIPVDSEHSAIFQCLRGGGTPCRIYLTASGGPFRGKSRSQLLNVSAKDALAHPNWSMGKKISVDSATLMNKGLEIIEAIHLFSMPVDNIEVLIHPQSIIHSMVGFADGSVIAQLALPDMRLPIQYALTFPNRLPSLSPPPSFPAHSLSFDKPDLHTFGCLNLAISAARNTNYSDCTVLNAANEIAVGAFLAGRIQFLDIERLVASALERFAGTKLHILDDIIEADNITRRYLSECIS